MISEETRGQYPGNAPALMFFAAGAAFANRPPFTVVFLPHFELARPDHKQSNATQHEIARREKCHPPVLPPSPLSPRAPIFDTQSLFFVLTQ